MVDVEGDGETVGVEGLDAVRAQAQRTPSRTSAPSERKKPERSSTGRHPRSKVYTRYLVASSAISRIADAVPSSVGSFDA